jgi:hypothetical protein
LNRTRKRLSRKHAALLLVLCGAALAPFVLIRGRPQPIATASANPVLYDDVVKGFADGDFVFEEAPDKVNGRPKYIGNNLVDQYTKVLVVGEKTDVRVAHVAVELSEPMRQWLNDPSTSIDDIEWHRAERRHSYMLRLIRNLSPSPQPVEAWLREAIRMTPERTREVTYRDGSLLWSVERMPEQPTVWRFSVMQR